MSKMATEKRLIYLEDAVALLEKEIAENQDALKYAYHGDKDNIRSEISALRSAITILKQHANHEGAVDAVEVVRCKDCEKAVRHEIFPHSRRCKVEDCRFSHKDTHYCSYGERRTYNED